MERKELIKKFGNIEVDMEYLISQKAAKKCADIAETHARDMAVGFALWLRQNTYEYSKSGWVVPLIAGYQSDETMYTLYLEHLATKS
jgi:hypothetical protein